MPKMRILHFAPSFFPACGGTTTRLYELLADSPNSNFLYIPQAPSMYIPGEMNELKEAEEFRGIRIRRCKLIENFKIKIPFFSWFWYFKINPDRILDYVKEKDIDIVHGHNPLEFVTAAMNYSRSKRIPFVYEIHTLSMDASFVNRKQHAPELFSCLIQKWFKSEEKKMCKYANAIIVQTEAMKKRITDLFKVSANKVKIIPNGIDKEEFNPDRWFIKGQELKKEKGWEGKIIFMYSGYLDCINGVDFLLDTVKELPSPIKQSIKVVIIGHGPLQRYVEIMSREKPDLIEYLGIIDYHDMPLYYCACEVVAVPRPHTPAADSLVSLKILEAMAMERIILGSNVGGIIELINTRNGVIFEKDDRKDFIRKVCYIVENIKEMDGLRKQARMDIIDIYSWERSREKLQKVYEGLSTKR